MATSRCCSMVSRISSSGSRPSRCNRLRSDPPADSPRAPSTNMKTVAIARSAPPWGIRPSRSRSSTRRSPWRSALPLSAFHLLESPFRSTETSSAPLTMTSRFLPISLVGEVGDAALDGLGVEEAHGSLVAGLAEEALAGAEHDREDLQPQLVDEVVLHQRAQELEAAGNE